MIESCIVAVPAATEPYSERPMISFRYTKSMNGRPPPPISAGCPSAHSPRALASSLQVGDRAGRPAGGRVAGAGDAT